MTQGKRTLNHRGWTNGVGGLSLLVALTTFGCGAGGTEEVGTENVASEQGPLWLWSGATLWPNGNVPVCWHTANAQADLDAYANRIRRELNDSWPAVARVQFTGWGTCPADTSRMVSIRIDTSFQNSDSGGFGITDAGLQMRLGRDATSNPRPGVVAHEFGHVLGFTHDMARADFADDAMGDCQEGNVDGNALNTPADRTSIMATTYCHNGGQLSLWDVVGVQTAYGARTDGVRPLVTGWHSGRGDHVSVSTSTGISSVTSAGYAWAYPEGWVFRDPMPGTVALQLYWHSGRGDHVSTANSNLQAAATAAGYTFVRNEGYVFTSAQPNTVQAEQYWHSGRQDHMLVTTADARANAIAAGYVRLHSEGFVPRNTPYAVGWAYWHPGRGDNLITAQNSALARDAEAAGYEFVGFDGAFFRNQYPSTVPLKQFWLRAREDHFATATSAGESSAVSAGYSNVGTEGFVYSSSRTGMSPFDSYWHAGRGDNFTTMMNGGVAVISGYARVRTEGWGLPTF